MKNHHGEIKLLTGTSHQKLAKKVVKNISDLLQTDIQLVRLEIGRFGDGEIRCRVRENVRGDDVFLLQSLHTRFPMSMFEEVELITDCIRDSAGRIIGVFPWTGYSKQDRRTVPRESRSFRVVAKRLSNCGLTRVLLFDLHNSTTADFFDIPSDHVYLMRLLIEEFEKRKSDNDVIGSPDIGSGKRVEAVSKITRIENICIVWKIHDPETKELDLKRSKVLGDVAGKVVWFFDDLIQSFSTLLEAAKLVKKAGAKYVIAAAVHPDFIPAIANKKSTIQRIEESEVDEVIVVDTIPHQDSHNWPNKIKIIDPAKFIAKIIISLHRDESLSKHFLRY